MTVLLPGRDCGTHSREPIPGRPQDRPPESSNSFSNDMLRTILLRFQHGHKPRRAPHLTDLTSYSLCQASVERQLRPGVALPLKVGPTDPAACALLMIGWGDPCFLALIAFGSLTEGRRCFWLSVVLVNRRWSAEQVAVSVQATRKLAETATARPVTRTGAADI